MRSQGTSSAPARPAVARCGRLLIVTDQRWVSALLFHSLGLPPWYDLPLLQAQPRFRRDMTARVNRLLDEAAWHGFKTFDVHEAFPVDLARIDARVRVLRSIDRLLPERRYGGMALLRLNCPEVPVQPRRRKLKAMTLDGQRVTERDLLCLAALEQDIPLVYSEKRLRGTWLTAAAPERRATAALRTRLAAGCTLVLRMAAGVPLKAWRGFPGVETIDETRRDIGVHVDSVQRWMEVYLHTGAVLAHAMERRP